MSSRGAAREVTALGFKVRERRTEHYAQLKVADWGQCAPAGCIDTGVLAPDVSKMDL